MSTNETAGSPKEGSGTGTTDFRGLGKVFFASLTSQIDYLRPIEPYRDLGAIGWDHILSMLYQPGLIEDIKERLDLIFSKSDEWNKKTLLSEISRLRIDYEGVLEILFPDTMSQLVAMLIHKE